jgi:hemoglobin
MSEDRPVTEAETIEMEQAIANLVRDFYGKARKDPELGPIFNNAVEDWDVHLRVVANFWSKVLLQTDRYSGHPYVHHVKLPIELEHFDIWLKLFTETANESLPPDYAAKAIAKAHHMAESFRVGLFPFQDQDGKPSRCPV